MRKIKLWLLTAVCSWACCCMLASPALAVEGTCGENAVWHLDEATGVLTISGTGAAGGWKSFWREYKDQILSVVVEDGITELNGDTLFAFHDNLTSVTVADSVKKIGQGVFGSCASLCEVDLPAECELGPSVFSNCPSLTEITLPLGTTIPMQLFSSCSGLERIIIPEGYTRIDNYAFYGCKSLKEIVLPESLKSMEIQAFSYCTLLERMVLKGTLETLECVSGNIKLPALTAIYCYGDAPGELTGYAEYSFNNNTGDGFSFYYIEGTSGWEKMTAYPTAVFDPSIPLPEFRTRADFAAEIMETLNTLKSGVKPYTYYLKDLTFDSTFREEDFAVVQETARQAVEGCTTDREKIFAIHDFTANWYYYDYDYFYNHADRVIEGTIGAFSLAQYLETGDMLYRVGVCEDYANLSCMLLRALGIPSVVLEGTADGVGHAWTAAYDGSQWVFFDSTWDSRNAYHSSTGRFETTTAGTLYANLSANSALWTNRLANRIYGVEAGDIYGTLNLNWTNTEMTYDIRGAIDPTAAEIVIPGQVGGKVTLKGTAFRNNGIVETVICGADVVESKAFEGCTALKHVTLTDQIVTIGSYAFHNCPVLETVNWQKSSLPQTHEAEIKGWAFYECPNLRTVQLPDNITVLGENAFADNTALQTVVLPESLKELASGTFARCTNLQTVVIPDDLHTIRSSAFQDCTSLQSIRLPASLQTVELWAFWNCSALEKVIFPEQVQTLGNALFHGCSALTEVYIPDSVKELGTYTFSGCTALKAVRLPANLASIPYGGFQNCSALEYVEIPETVQMLDHFAFQGCASLREIHLPDGLQTVGQEAFSGCAALRVLYIPDSVQTCGPWVVSGCTSLEGLYIGGGVEFITGGEFAHTPSLKWVRLPETVTYCTDMYTWDNWRETPLEAVIFSGPLPNKGTDNPTGFYGVSKVYYPADDPTWLGDLPGRDNEFIPYQTDGLPQLDIGSNFPIATVSKPDAIAKPAILVVATYDQQGKMTSVGTQFCEPWAVPVCNVPLTVCGTNAVLGNATAFWIDDCWQTPLTTPISA